MGRRLRYQMVKSAALRQQSLRRQRVREIQIEREIEKIEGEDPLCLRKKTLKEM